MAKKPKIPAIAVRNLRPVYVVVDSYTGTVEEALNDSISYSTLKAAKRGLKARAEDACAWMSADEAAAFAIVKVSYEVVGEPVYFTGEAK